MRMLRYEFLLEASTPLAHHAEVFGNSAVLMDRKVRLPDGRFVRVPCVTGDTMRHGMREAAAYSLLDAAGLLKEGSLSEAALRLLFAGGMVTGRGDASVVRLDAYRRMVDLIPTMALFGGCADNRVIPGRLDVDDAQLVCEESRHAMPSWVLDWMREHQSEAASRRSHVEVVQRVRMDPALNPGKRRLLTAGAAAAVEQRLLESEAAHHADSDIERQAAKSTMMPRTFEVLVQGSLLFWRVGAACYSDLDEDTFHVALGAFLANAQVGGKRATGHGRLRVVTARDVRVRRPSEAVVELDTSALGARMGETFRRHVQERADAIREWLASVNA